MYDILVKHGADPNKQDTFGNTVLHLCVIHNKIVSNTPRSLCNISPVDSWSWRTPRYSSSLQAHVLGNADKKFELEICTFVSFPDIFRDNVMLSIQRDS